MNEIDVLDLLGSLVEKSLVTLNSDSDRYRMLQTLRQYASEKLDASNETATYRQQHAEYFLKLAEEADPQLSGNDQAKWFNRLETEHDNLHAALEWALDSSKTETAQRLAGALGRFWWVHGHMTEGRHWLRRALENREGVAKSVQAKALRWAGALGRRVTSIRPRGFSTKVYGCAVKLAIKVAWREGWGIWDPWRRTKKITLVRAISTAIDTGHVYYVPTSYLGGYDSQDDSANFSVIFYNGSNANLGSFSYSGPNAAQRGDQTGLFPSVFVRGTVPVGTRRIHVSLNMVNAGSGRTYSDSYADNLSFVLQPSPL